MNSHRSGHSQRSIQDFLEAQVSYRNLRDIYSERIRSIVAWVGAGFSADANIPTWTKLRHDLQTAARSSILTLSEADRSGKSRHLELAKKAESPWDAFESIERAIGEPSFRVEVRKLLRPLPDAEVPQGYKKLWSMRLSGIITTNIDRLASRAFGFVRSEHLTDVPNGFALKRYAHIFQSNAPFVVNSHGVYDDAEKWVFTATQLRRLLSSGYVEVINALAMHRSILFVGISADDVATGGILLQLAQQGFDFGDHFWITSRRDEKTDAWADRARIQVIRYKDEWGHDTFLDAFINLLKGFVAKDVEAPPVTSLFDQHAGTGLEAALLAQSPLPPPRQLLAQTPEEIRLALSHEAKRRVRNASDEKEAKQSLGELMERYRHALHNAYYVALNAPDNVFFGYTVKELIGEGAFGKVYRASGSDRTDVAIKIMHQTVINDANMLGSFRRGVNSMKILADAHVEGIVTYLLAFDLPPAVVMEYVYGVNLQDAVESGNLDRWHDGLRIAHDVVKIIRRGHLLPQRVLHRDLRPANIMLRGFYSESWDVVVLDFDLSWHKGATEKSIIVDQKFGAALGYLAPEQLSTAVTSSTRSTAVDAYGLCMTLYFLFTGKHPTITEAVKHDWGDKVRLELTKGSAPQWRSLPVRLARLITMGTEQDQDGRLDMSEVEREIAVLYDLLCTSDVQSAELWAEELLCRAFGCTDYRWDWASKAGVAPLFSGATISLAADEGRKEVTVSVEKLDRGDTRWESTKKYFPQAFESISADFVRRGLSIIHGSAATRSVKIVARVEVDRLRSSEFASGVVACLSNAKQLLSFD